MKRLTVAAFSFLITTPCFSQYAPPSPPAAAGQGKVFCSRRENVMAMLNIPAQTRGPAAAYRCYPVAASASVTVLQTFPPLPTGAMIWRVQINGGAQGYLAYEPPQSKIAAASSTPVAPTLPKPSTVISRIGTWTIEEKKDPITDEIWVIAQSTSGDVAGTWLQVRCEDKKPLLVIGIKGATFPVGQSLGGALRIDGNLPTSAGFIGIGDSGAVGTALSKEVYGSLLMARSLGIRVVRDSEVWTFSFNLQRTDQALKPIASACPISAAYDAQPTNVDAPPRP
jgi:hypothetical protein